MTEPNRGPVGGAIESQLAAIATKGTLPDPDGDPLPWDASWMDTFDAWSDCEGSPVLLLFAPMPRVVGEQVGGAQLALFAQNPKAPSSGAYIVGRAGTTFAWRVPIGGGFDDMCASIAGNSFLKDLPVVVLRLRKRRMYFFANGLGASDDVPAEIPLDRVEAELNWPKLLAQLQAFESECLNTLEMMPKVWTESAKWWPNQNAELVIHAYLLVALRMIFRGFTTMSEVNLPVGRADILMQPRDPNVATRAVVELKVLRTFSFTGDTEYNETHWEETLEEGRRQAIEYAAKSGAAIKALCAYDMRKAKTPSVLESARLMCEQDGVELSDFQIQNNVKEVRRLSVAATTK